VAATFNINRPSGTSKEQMVQEMLQETIIALKMRIWHLEEKMRLRPGVYRGGQHILKMVGYDPASGRLVMKAAGQTLEKVFPWGELEMPRFMQQRAERKYFTAMLASIAFQVLEALDFLQARQMVHSDLKLENITIDGQGKVTVIDVGGAVDIKSSRRAATPGYCTSERMSEIHRRAGNARFTDDLYALGCTLIYCCLGGQTGSWSRRENMHKRVLDKVGSKALSSFVSKLMQLEKMHSENKHPEKKQFVGLHRMGYPTAAAALQDPFLSKASRAPRSWIYKEYLRNFVMVDPDDNSAVAATAGRGRANALADRWPLKPKAPAEGSWDKFVAEYPRLVNALEEATSLAAKAAAIKQSMSWKQPWIRRSPTNQLA
jgi:serine/threonine protein kinase